MECQPKEISELARDNLFLLPAWRWERIAELHDVRANPTRLDDECIPEGLDFCRTLSAANTKAKRTTVQLRHPGLYIAFQIMERANTERWQIEAMIVASVPTQEIADYMGTTLRVLTAYESYFFSVRERLRATGYVVSQLLRPAIVAGLDELDRDFLWKMLGYFGGGQVLQQFWAMGKLDPEVENFLKDSIEGKMDKDALKATYAQEVNKFTAGKVLELYLKRKELDIQQAAALGGTMGAESTAAAQSLIDCLQFSMMPRTPQVFIDKAKAEFRASELLSESQRKPALLLLPAETTEKA